MPERGLRRLLGRVLAVFGAAHLLPTAFVWLSGGGPAPIPVSPSAWSMFFYAHFVLLCAAGLGLQAWSGWRSRLFHEGALVDFLVGVAGFMILESAAAEFVRGGGRLPWTMLVPGAALLAYGLRVATGAPVLRD